MARSADISWAIDHADSDALIDSVDSLCLDARFDEVVSIRQRCRVALERGLQLWPVAAYCDYRLALDAPGRECLTGLGELSERFMLGPFAEVLASTHTFANVRAWLPNSPEASAVAQECVVRGADLQNDEVALALPDIMGIPLALANWEPQYVLAEYLPGRANFPAPSLPAPTTSVALLRSDGHSDPAVWSALRDLVSPWTASSNGVVQVSAVEGTAEEAIGALGLSRALTIELESREALAWMAWAAASGGARGRRRGAAAGRQQTWWALRALTGLDDDEHVDVDELGEAAQSLRWVRWNDGSPDTGWALRLAIEDPIDGLAWVIGASDAQ